MTYDVTLALANFQVTEAARKHFQKLIQDENIEGANIRISVSHAYTPKADVNLFLCPPGGEEVTDLPWSIQNLTIFIARDAIKALQDARIDYVEDDFGGNLSIKAPHLKLPVVSSDGALADMVTGVLEEINVQLALHRGHVSLVEVTAGNIVVLQFGGGCHGCGMVNVTLREGIEKTLKERLPEINKVVDVTDHKTGGNPYYRNSAKCEN